MTNEDIRAAVTALLAAAERPEFSQADCLIEDGEADGFTFTGETVENFVASGWEVISSANGVTEMERTLERIRRGDRWIERKETIYLTSCGHTGLAFREI